MSWSGSFDNWLGGCEGLGLTDGLGLGTRIVGLGVCIVIGLGGDDRKGEGEGEREGAGEGDREGDGEGLVMGVGLEHSRSRIQSLVSSESSLSSSSSSSSRAKRVIDAAIVRVTSAPIITAKWIMPF